MWRVQGGQRKYKNLCVCVCVYRVMRPLYTAAADTAAAADWDAAGDSDAAAYVSRRRRRLPPQDKTKYERLLKSY